VARSASPLAARWPEGPGAPAFVGGLHTVALVVAAAAIASLAAIPGHDPNH
jgi:hypothetical protein